MNPLAKLYKHRESNPLEELYETKRRVVTYDMQYDTFNCTLIIWNRNGPVSPDFLSTFLEDLCPDVEIRHHWTPRLPWCQNFAAGATAVFNNAATTNLVAKKLRMFSRTMMAVPFEYFFHALVEAEIRHPDFGRDFTRLIIKGMEPFDGENENTFGCKLMDFGQCEFIEFEKNVCEYGTICTAVYRFAAQAIGAKSILDGSLIDEIGEISVEVKMTSKVRQILGYVKNYFM